MERMTRTPKLAKVAVLISLAIISLSNPIYAAPLKTLPLRYDEALRKIGFPSPLLAVRVAGTDAYFLIDTGAGVHTFARWFVAAQKLTAMSSDLKMLDSAGHPVETTVVRNVRLALAQNATIEIGEAAVADFPPIFEEHKIAGLLSPQLLAPASDAAVLDLRKPELRFEPAQSAVDHLHAIGLGSAASVCSHAGAPLANRVYTVRTTIDGVGTWLTLDTGATTTTLRDGTPAANAARRKPGTSHDEMGTAGQRAHVFQSAPLSVDFGAGARTLAVGVGEDSGICDAQGRLGMDALTGCRWILARDALALSCADDRSTPQ